MPSIPEDKLKIGQALLAGGPITQEALQRELDGSGKSDSVLGKALLQAGFPREEDLVYTLLSRLRIPRINAKNTKIPLETIALVPAEVAIRGKVLALDQMGQVLIVVTPDAGNVEAMGDVRKATGMLVFPIQADMKASSEADFVALVEDYYQQLEASGIQPATAAPAAGAAAAAPAASGNGVVQAIPVGDASEDAFFRRYMSAGPVPAAAQLM